MIRRRLAVLLLSLLAAACGTGGDQVIAIEGVTLIDGSGGAPKEDAVIIIRNGHIEAIARVNEIQIPKNAQRINGVGKTVIPGLIDAHAHVEPSPYAPRRAAVSFRCHAPNSARSGEKGKRLCA